MIARVKFFAPWIIKIKAAKRVACTTSPPISGPFTHITKRLVSSSYQVDPSDDANVQPFLLCNAMALKKHIDKNLGIKLNTCCFLKPRIQRGMSIYINTLKLSISDMA